MTAMEALDEIRRLTEREYRCRARGSRADRVRIWHEYIAVRIIRDEVKKIIKQVRGYGKR